MIQVPRIGKPAILAAKEVEWKTAITASSGKKQRVNAQKKYGHKEIKSALVQMFSGKCAYCESRIKHIDYGHIEHFKPKSWPQFYELAVEWSNLLLACGICNGAEYKGVQFPEASDDGPIVDPSSEDPGGHLKFEFDPATGLANVLSTTARGKTTIRVLGLDRLELVRHRSGFVKKLVVIARMYTQDTEARQLIDASVSEDAEYRAFAIPIRNAVLSPAP